MSIQFNTFVLNMKKLQIQMNLLFKKKPANKMEGVRKGGGKGKFQQYQYW